MRTFLGLLLFCTNALAQTPAATPDPKATPAPPQTNHAASPTPTPTSASAEAPVPGEPNNALIDQKKAQQVEQEKKESTPTPMEQKAGTVDFNSIKDVLKNDGLNERAQKIEQSVKKVAKKRV